MKLRHALAIAMALLGVVLIVAGLFKMGLKEEIMRTSAKIKISDIRKRDAPTVVGGPRGNVLRLREPMESGATEAPKEEEE